ncbi:hydrogenase formation protein HypD [Paraburkholderia sp. J67]|uniref:hydrogenase formation protein HypD n=1 Tax=Paraburkholderia sp. J67 TaxID=2805435 RepID=UPI002ABD6ADE|nr:hydrogenase formation protein HypD [Paraburkholderia sp. J67]
MKLADDIRHNAIARGLCARLHEAVELRRRYRLISFCHSHAQAITRHGLGALLPSQIELIHGPGCPDCILPAAQIDAAIDLACSRGVTLCASDDLLRVPGAHHTNLFAARAAGADIVAVATIAEALALARAHPQRDIVHLASGFETTAPASAEALLRARDLALGNFSVLSHHVLTPAAMRHLLADDAIGERMQLNGFIAPSHVSRVIGVAPYRSISSDYVKPIVIAGPEPLDVLHAVLMLVEQINECRADTENQYARAVTETGDTAAQRLVDEVFEVRESFLWRGLGRVPHSALTLRPAFAQWDAERRHALGTPEAIAMEISAGHAASAACTPFTPLDPHLSASACGVRGRFWPIAS